MADSEHPPDPPAMLGDLVSPAELLRHGRGNAATGGVWRIRTTKSDAVVKPATPPNPDRTGVFWPTSDEPTHWNHWRRETLAHRSGLAHTAYRDAGITAPALLESLQRPDGTIELFRLPDQPWLSRDWLSQYGVEGPSRTPQPPAEAWNSELATTAWPAHVRSGLQRLWAERDRVLATALAYPRTLSHLDVWPSNLIVDSCADGFMDISLLPQIAHDCLDTYIDGLREGGWNGSADQVRAAVAATGAAKYSWLGPAFLARAARGDESRRSYGQDATSIDAVHRLTGLVTLLVEWAEATLGS